MVGRRAKEINYILNMLEPRGRLCYVGGWCWMMVRRGKENNYILNMLEVVCAM